MTNQKPFPSQQEGRLYLSEGGTETEIMYKWGFELPPVRNVPTARKSQRRVSYARDVPPVFRCSS